MISQRRSRVLKELKILKEITENHDIVLQCNNNQYLNQMISDTETYIQLKNSIVAAHGQPTQESIKEWVRIVKKELETLQEEDPNHDLLSKYTSDFISANVRTNEQYRDLMTEIVEAHGKDTQAAIKARTYAVYQELTTLKLTKPNHVLLSQSTPDFISDNVGTTEEYQDLISAIVAAHGKDTQEAIRFRTRIVKQELTTLKGVDPNHDLLSKYTHDFISANVGTTEEFTKILYIITLEIMTLMLNLLPKSTDNDMYTAQQQFSQFIRQFPSGSFGYVYFAGHGCQPEEDKRNVEKITVDSPFTF